MGRTIDQKIAQLPAERQKRVKAHADELIVQEYDFSKAKRATDVPHLTKLQAEALADLETPLRERGIVSLALFGSFVRGQARADSDVDVLVDIDPNTHFSLTDLVSLQHFLENQLGRKVDVVTRQGIEPAIRDSVLREAEGIF